MAFKFEELIIWQKALELTLLIHNVTVKFPKSEQSILTPQIKRACDSIALNIAEESTGQSDSEFNKFLGYALRSAIEVVSCVFIALKRNIISEEDFKRLYNFTSEEIRMIQALRKTLRYIDK